MHLKCKKTKYYTDTELEVCFSAKPNYSVKSIFNVLQGNFVSAKLGLAIGIYKYDEDKGFIL